MISAAAASIVYDDRPSVLVVGEPASAAVLAGLVEQIGARPARLCAPAEVAALIASGGSYDAIYYNRREDSDPGRADHLLTWLNGAAGEGGLRAIVEIAPDDIDTAEALAPHPDIALVCAGDDVDRLVALALAVRRQGEQLHDVVNEVGVTRLAQLSEEVGRIARALATLAQSTPVAPSSTPAPVPSVFLDDDVTLGATLRALIRSRRARGQFFPGDLFADPGWDILLDLMAARCERRRVSVSSLCIAAAVPPTTALRWIKQMTSAGLLIRQADVADGRRIFIDLADNAVTAMRAYFAQEKATPGL